MNKQELTILSEIQGIIEERNALRADKAALIDALRLCVTACEHCDHQFDKPCDVTPGHEMDCIICTDVCPCKDCKAGCNFKWVGRVELGKHAAKPSPADDMPIGIRAAMEEDKARKKGENHGRK